MLEELDADDAIVLVGLEFVGYDVARDDAEVCKVFRDGDGVDVLLLGARVGESCDFGIWEEFGHEERCGSPAAPVTESY